MIFILITILVKKYQLALRINPKLKGMTLYFTKRLLSVLVLLICTLLAFAQELKYDVIKGGNKIGTIQVNKTTYDSITEMKLFSKVKAHMLVQLQINSWESAQYKNGRLMYASVVRKVNGRNKVNIELKWNGSRYQLVEGGESKGLQQSTISNNILLLYFEEPKNINKVFSESHKRWIDIKKSGLAQYKLLLPDGSSSEYFYENGTCSRVMVNNTFYNATFQRAQ